ncbi:PIN domain-containing protein [Mesorhizobium sp. SP-1A]|uniref:PIN domain-containing protein n=1 Tax=Mesorhizobium sp. SP-1A TaxID=3077840 RepID=UPI0028F72067|nr:PIN domain-containing protein [Mesorhizobium sp. SP-1A]
MPGAKIFVDTNVLLYAVDETELAKGLLAQQWLLSLTHHGAGSTNLQVLNETTSLLLRRRRDVHPADVFAIVDRFSRLGTQPLGAKETSLARSLHLRLRYSWWDCLLLASALELGCTHFLSEDLQDGQAIEDTGGKSLTIVDPFAHSPEQILNPR